MHRIVVDAEGKLLFPPEVRHRYELTGGEELLLEETDAGLVLHPLRLDLRKVYVEVTTNCNLRCRTCVRNVWSEPLGEMSDTTFEHLISQLEAFPRLEEVAFGGYGEPFAHPNFVSYLEKVKTLGLKVTISTNGTLLDEKLARELVALGVDNLFISLDGTESKTYEHIREGADLRTVLNNMELLNRVKAEREALFPRLGVEFVVLKHNVADLAGLSELARRLQIQRVIVTHVLPHTPEMAAEAVYARDQVAPLPSAVGWPFRSGDWLLWGIVELPRMNWGAERRCRFVTGKALVVGWDGGVSPCYALSHSYPYYIFGRRKLVTRYTFGNINETPLAEIWTAGNYVRFRAEVRRFNFPSCVDCNLRDTCDIAENNDGCWGWCPSCADCLWAQDIVRCP